MAPALAERCASTEAAAAARRHSSAHSSLSRLARWADGAQRGRVPETRHRARAKKSRSGRKLAKTLGVDIDEVRPTAGRDGDPCRCGVSRPAEPARARRCRRGRRGNPNPGPKGVQQTHGRSDGFLRVHGPAR